MMKLKIEYEMMKMNEEKNKMNIEIAFKIKKKMQKWFRNRNKILNEKKRKIIYYFQKDWMNDFYEFLNKEMRENIYDIYHVNLSKKMQMMIYQE